MCLGRPCIKTIAALLIATIANMALLPLAQAVQIHNEQARQHSLAQAHNNASTRYADALAQLKATAAAEQTQPADPSAQPQRARSPNPVTAETFSDLAAQVQQEFADLRDPPMQISKILFTEL